MTLGRLEKLKVVFQLDTERLPKATQTRGGKLVKVAPVLTADGLSGSQVFQCVLDVMKRLDMAAEFTLHGEPISLQRLQEKIEASPIWPNGIVSNRLSLQFGLVTSWKQSFLLVEELESGVAKAWSDWVEPFLGKAEFVQAWISDKDYDYWQNAKDPKVFESAGREYAHLPMKSNGLPPPLTQNVIDTSGNPGRWSLKSGYIEAVGSAMWLGEPFWRLVGDTRRAELLSADWLEVGSAAAGVLFVKSAKHAFCEHSSDQTQDQLRAILYGPKA